MSSITNKFQIYSEHNLIIEIHTGKLDLKSYLDFKRKLFSHNNFKSGMNYFINVKQVEFNASKEEILEFAEFNNKRPAFKERRKIALITDTPSQVVSTTIYKSMLNNHNQDIDIFTTNEKALNWLLQNKFNENISVILSKLPKPI